MKILFEMLFKLNEFKYASVIENDLVHIIQSGRVKEIAPFFDISQQENQDQDIMQENIYCNFEKVLKDDKLPHVWFENSGSKSLYQGELFEDENQEEEIVDLQI